jgi:hypothetical protein
LPQVIDALAAPAGLSGRLNRGKQEGDKNADDRDDNQQLDQSKRARSSNIGIRENARC